MTNLNKSKILENFNGIILVNKEKGITSFGVVKKIRWVFF
jgi:tRNA U55 pseudouridine synthase TruB